jgi:hypothetical protein
MFFFGIIPSSSDIVAKITATFLNHFMQHFLAVRGVAQSVARPTMHD